MNHSRPYLGHHRRGNYPGRGNPPAVEILLDLARTIPRGQVYDSLRLEEATGKFTTL